MAEITTDASSGITIRKRRRNPVVDIVIRMYKTKQLGFISLIIIFILCVVAIFADQLAPYHWNEVFLLNRLSPPSSEFLLGTDGLGRDLLSRIIYGARISVTVAMYVQIIHYVISLSIALPSGYFGGKFDLILQRFIDAWMSLPALVIYLTVMAILGPGLWQLIIVLGVSSGIGRTRITRSNVMRIREAVYFEAARSIGAPTSRILWRHVLPNILPLTILGVASGMGGVILAEASLSFLGFGIPPPYPSWGGMLSSEGRNYMIKAPWLMIWPGLCLSAVIFSFQMLADALRDLLDPRLRGGLGSYNLPQEKLKEIAEKKSAELQRELEKEEEQSRR